MNKEIIAKNITRYLAVFDMNKSDLARMLGVSTATVSGWTNGVYYPRIQYIEQMADIFHCQKSDLIEDKSKPYKAYDLTTEEYLIIEAYRSVEPLQQEMVKMLLNYSSRLKELEKRIHE